MTYEEKWKALKKEIKIILDKNPKPDDVYCEDRYLPYIDIYARIDTQDELDEEK